jgi:hypothetical protein
MPFVGFHGTLSSYLCDALHEDGATVVAYLPPPRAKASAHVFFSSLLVHSTTSYVLYKKAYNYTLDQ